MSFYFVFIDFCRQCVIRSSNLINSTRQHIFVDVKFDRLGLSAHLGIRGDKLRVGKQVEKWDCSRRKKLLCRDMDEY